jgi:hypothetical protein
VWRRGARLELAREVRSEVRDRDVRVRHALRRHRRDEIDVALDERVLGDDGERVLACGEHREDRARDAERALGRLVRIGVRAERDRARTIGGRSELQAQQRRRVRLGEDARFEVEPGRQTEVCVRRAGVAVHAAVLAPAVRIDRLIERDVGGVVARDD